MTISESEETIHNKGRSRQDGHSWRIFCQLVLVENWLKEVRFHRKQKVHVNCMLDISKNIKGLAISKTCYG